MAGKGDKRRPVLITSEEWDANFKKAFRRAKQHPGKWTAVHPKFKHRQKGITNLPEMDKGGD